MAAKRRRRQPSRRPVRRSVLKRALDAARLWEVSWWWERLDISTAQITCVACGLRRRHFLPGMTCRGVEIRHKAALRPKPERVTYSSCPLIKTAPAVCGQARAVAVAIGADAE